MLISSWVTWIVMSLLTRQEPLSVNDVFHDERLSCAFSFKISYGVKSTTRRVTSGLESLPQFLSVFLRTPSPWFSGITPAHCRPTESLGYVLKLTTVLVVIPNVQRDFRTWKPTLTAISCPGMAPFPFFLHCMASKAGLSTYHFPSADFSVFLKAFPIFTSIQTGDYNHTFNHSSK